MILCFIVLIANWFLFWLIGIVAENSMNSVIQAHETELGALSVNPDGTLIASASQRGTVIKIFSADGGETLQTLRRGSGNAII